MCQDNRGIRTGPDPFFSRRNDKEKISLATQNDLSGCMKWATFTPLMGKIDDFKMLYLLTYSCYCGEIRSDNLRHRYPQFFEI